MTVSNEIRELALACAVEYVAHDPEQRGLDYPVVKRIAKKGGGVVTLRMLVESVLERAPLGVGTTDIVNAFGATGNPVAPQVATMVRSLLGLGTDVGAPSDPVRAAIVEKIKNGGANAAIEMRKAAIERAKAAIAAAAAAKLATETESAS